MPDSNEGTRETQQTREAATPCDKVPQLLGRVLSSPPKKSLGEARTLGAPIMISLF